MFKTLIKYWRTSLADSDLTRIANQWKAVETMPSNLANGVVPLGLAEEIRSLLGMDSPRQDDLNIIIAPFVLQRGREAVSHGKIEKALGAKEIVPLLISAVLRTDNTISLDESKVWIPREFLEPSDGNNVYGAVDDFDAYISNKLPHRDEGWVDYQHIWNYAVGMAQAVFECEYGNAGNFDGIYSVSENLRVYALMEKKITATTKLIELYDFILHRVEDKGKIPDLLRLCSPVCWPIHKSPISDSDIKNVVAKHVASMHANYPLSLSQRQSLIHCTEAGYGEVICINGPPGTGKTTLLQSVIANEWAASAIAGNNEPPLILATSTNNQAVTNIIEAFKARPGYRWLPEIEGFGLWFPSKKKMNESMGFLHVSHTNPDASNGLYRLVHNAVFFRKAEQQMLLACSTEEKKEAKDIKYVLDVVKRRLKILDNDLRNIFTLSKEINEATKRITSICGNEPDLYLRNLISDKETAEQNLSEIGDCRQSWLSILESEPWVLKFFGRLGLLNNKRKERIKLAISYFPRIKQYEQEIKWVSLLRGKDDSLIESLQMAEEQIKANLSPILSEIATINKLLEKRKDNKKNLCALFKKYGIDSVLIKNCMDMDYEIQQALDTTLRYSIFIETTHYWEAQFLIHLRKNMLNNNLKKRVKLQALAMLSPCFVATAYKAPSLAESRRSDDGSASFELGMFDLLIIDEAGQMSPEVSGGLLGLAKKAVIVGDRLQIEPVWGVNETIDQGNRAYGILSDMDDKDFGVISAAKGSTILLAQRMCKYKQYEDMPGLSLVEHRRCREEIISYCNMLAYQGRLTPMRKDKGIYNDIGFSLPPIAYGHVRGKAERKNGSWKNIPEASAIAQWIGKHRERICGGNGALSEYVAVITPFTSQAREIKAALNRVLGEQHNITVGTVHSMQGAERHLIIFSPTYSKHSMPGVCFFDRGVNLLNVAVSRAKDCFMVIGDIGLFSPTENTPSGILASYMFDAEEVPIDPPVLVKTQKSIRRIRSLEGHCKELSAAFINARKSIIISSPFITENAINADDIVQKISTVTKRGVRVHVYTDPTFLNHSKKIEENNSILERLKESGAIIHRGRIHAKILCTDESTLVEGSFNWLSASRNKKYARYESSIVYTGEDTKNVIVGVKKDLQTISNKAVVD